MRLQSIVGNTTLVIEAELFGQPGLRAKWKKECAGRPEAVGGLSVDEHIRTLTDQLMPLIERFHRMGRETIEALGRLRQGPSLQVERARAIEIVLV
jgi:hypothetical protein